MVGSEDDIWSGAPGPAFRALVTLRMCIEAIRDLVEGKHTVTASFVKAVVMQSDDLVDAPFCLSEMAEFLMNDSEGRDYWTGAMPDDRYPVTCPLCKVSAAYVGANTVECKSKCEPSSSRL